MAERQVSAWLSGDFSYVARSTWVPMDEIAPVKIRNSRNTPGLIWPPSGPRWRTRVRGGSTLTQQMVKNLFLWDGRSWLRKGLEAGITVGVELVWTKRRILTVYLNIVEFGPGIFGVQQAAQHFFNKPASRFTAGEAALLAAAVLPNPIRFRVNTPSRYVSQRQQ